ncbi:MAG: ATP-NAD kinase family protein [Candidatus Bathyarchaeia archaeon]
MTVPQKSLATKTLGFIVNPVAGMGGAVGLKGTDGKAVLEKAISLGAQPVASQRAETFLAELVAAKESLKLIVGAGCMGENQAEKCGFAYEAKGKRKSETTSEDTQDIAREMLAAHVGLLVFCGGDGTARDILKAVGMKVPVLGVPTGVKMHSAVFAVTPQATARVAIKYLWNELPLREAEVMDVDEQAFRENRLSAALYGYLLSPYEPHLIQGNKLESPMTESEVRNQAAIAIYIIEEMKPNLTYVIGPGTTTRTIGDLLDQKKTLLGVDVFQNKKIVAADVNEKQILEATKNQVARIIVTPIGGQGFIFGRGNQQLSSRVIRQIGLENIVVVATKNKLDRMKSLRVDTGDPELDKELKTLGVRVVTDYKITQKINIE